MRVDGFGRARQKDSGAGGAAIAHHANGFEQIRVPQAKQIGGGSLAPRRVPERFHSQGRDDP